ncbi:MAG: NAD-dependent deacylase [Gammaproteobacteria bacterium]|nr:NAD-dependent deacylase [Gammaproteobacteria bacterium]
MNAADFAHIVIFTGAGMSAESGVPTYRGQGGIWASYRWQDYACQAAFEQAPRRVQRFHELRRRHVLSCAPHAGHTWLAALGRSHPSVTIVTQNTDGMHQRAGSRTVVELHGSLWRLRCADHGVREDLGGNYAVRRCPACAAWLRPDIVWFEDALDERVLAAAAAAIARSELFVSVGTSGVVWPAAGFQQLARRSGARMIEVNPEPCGLSHLYDRVVRAPASVALPRLFTSAGPAVMSPPRDD